MGKGGQAWYLDLVAGMLIFIIGLVAYYHANINISHDDIEGYGDLLRNADSIEAMLMTPGYPDGWNASTVEQIGVVDDHRLRPENWARFSGIPYNQSKSIFGTPYDFAAFVEEINGTVANVSGACAVGYPSVIVGCQNIDMGMVSYKSLARKERYAFHKFSQRVKPRSEAN